MKWGWRAAVVTCCALALTACSSPLEDLETECLARAASAANVDPATLVITERNLNPVGGTNWRGTYPGGQFGCAGARAGDELVSVVAY